MTTDILFPEAFALTLYTPCLGLKIYINFKVIQGQVQVQKLSTVPVNDVINFNQMNN